MAAIWPVIQHDGTTVAEWGDERAALLLDNARLHQELQRRDRRIRELEAAIHIDGLTGIANRRWFDEVWAREWQRAQREQRWLSVCMLDVDCFKAYNDHYGHHAGDDCLRQVARHLSASLRRGSDFVARFGGDEFVIILSDHELTVACERMEVIRQCLLVRALPHVHNAGTTTVSFSAGLAATVPAPGQQADSLLAAADAKLYCAKASGRNRVCR